MKIKINNYEWEIKMVSPNEMEDELGKCDYLHLTISIRASLEKQLLNDTITHEIIHAYIFSYGLFKNEGYSNEEITNFFAQNIQNIVNLTTQVCEKIDKDGVKCCE